MAANPCTTKNIADITMCYSSPNLESYWCQYSCPQQFVDALNSGSTVWGFSQANLLQVQQYVTKLFQNYLTKYEFTDNTESPKYNDFQYTILDLCTDTQLPGVCDVFLTQYCSAFSRNSLMGESINSSFCGCYVPPDAAYLSITNNAACDPLCNRANNVRIAINGVIQTCPQNICVIDDTTIQAQSSTVSQINFTSICSGCGNTGSNSCLCVVQGPTISGTLNKIGVVNINQYCGPDSICLYEQNGVTVQKKCNESELGSLSAAVDIPTPNIIVIFIAIILIVIVILMIF